MTTRPLTNQSQLTFSFMAALAGKMRQLVELELAGYGAQRSAGQFALDYIPPIMLGNEMTPVALVCKIAYTGEDQVRLERLYWLKIHIPLSATLEAPHQSAVLTQLAYQLARGIRSHIRSLNQGYFIRLDHNEGLTETMQASGQRIKV